MKHAFLLSALCLGLDPCMAQMPPTCVLIDAGFITTSWGGVTETADGGAAFTGGHDLTNAGNSDVVVTKLDASGALQWIKTYSTGLVPAEYGRDIIATSDGGLAVAGHLEAGVVFIMKLDANGDQQWTKTYDAPGFFGLQMASGFVQLADDGYALICTSQFLPNDAWLMLRTDASGDVVWSDRLDYTGGYPMDVAALPNGDLVFIGQETGLGNPSAILRKDGLTGATEWIHWYNAGPDYITEMHGLEIAPDSTIVVAGIVSGPIYTDAFALALSPDGTPLWSTHIGTDEIEYAENIARAPNGDYLLAGARKQDTTFYPTIGSFVMRLDPNGQLLWSKQVSHTDVTNGWPVRCAAASDGGVLVTAYAGTTTNYPQSFIKLDANGNTCPYCPSVDVGEQDTLALGLTVDQGHAFIGPWATAADLTFTVADLTPTVGTVYCGISGVDEAVTAQQVFIVPDPFVDHATLTLEGTTINGNSALVLRDLSGRIVSTQRLAGTTTVIERGGITAGHYVFTVEGRQGIVAHGAVQVAPRQ